MSGSSDRLIIILDETIKLLRRYEVSHWAKWLSNDLSQIRQSNTKGLDHLLSTFGGMGSFNDLWVCPENGHKVDSSDVRQVNAELQNLSSEIYKLATELKSR